MLLKLWLDVLNQVVTRTSPFKHRQQEGRSSLFFAHPILSHPEKAPQNKTGGVCVGQGTALLWKRTHTRALCFCESTWLTSGWGGWGGGGTWVGCVCVCVCVGKFEPLSFFGGAFQNAQRKTGLNKAKGVFMRLHRGSLGPKWRSAFFPAVAWLFDSCRIPCAKCRVVSMSLHLRSCLSVAEDIHVRNVWSGYRSFTCDVCL